MQLKLPTTQTPVLKFLQTISFLNVKSKLKIYISIHTNSSHPTNLAQIMKHLYSVRGDVALRDIFC